MKKSPFDKIYTIRMTARQWDQVLTALWSQDPRDNGLITALYDGMKGGLIYAITDLHDSLKPKEGLK